MAEALPPALHPGGRLGLRRLTTLVLAVLATWGAPAAATPAPSAAPDPVLEARMMAVAAELRCLVCQNQSIADSHAGLAQDLRQQIREMLAQGQDERRIRDYMTQRYGDFVLYRPPLKASTLLLWAGPGLLLAAALGGLAVVLRRRQHLDASAFDPDSTLDPEPADVPPR